MADPVNVTQTMRKPQNPVVAWFIGLILLNLLIRFGLWLTYEPIFFGDTDSYLRLGEWILGTGERGFDGTRVPGYPLFVALFGLDPQHIWLGQMGLGVAISGMLFYLGWRSTGKAWAGFLLGVIYSVIPGQILFEANLLTETLTTSLIILSLVLFQCMMSRRLLAERVILGALLGISTSLVGMVRPLFFPLTLIVFPFIWFGLRGTYRQRITLAAVYSIFPVFIQGGWLLYMRTSWDVLSPTTMAGFSMVQHTGGYFDYLPDEYAAIRDTYIEYRDAQIAERGVQTNAIWEAIPAITEASGIGFYDLERELYRLSWMLIRQHPELYGQNVFKGWINFWKAPVYWQPEQLASGWIRSAIQGLAWFGRGVSVLANILFLILSLGVVISLKLRSSIRMGPLLWLSLAAVWLISIVQTLLDHGDNPRFLVPMQMMVFFVVMVAIVSIREHLEMKKGT